MRVVLDTNTLVSALLFRHGRLAQVRDLWTAHRIEPLVCTATMKELIRVLAYPKFGLDEEGVQTVLAAYVPFTVTVALSAPTSPRLPQCDDPDDQIFLDLALLGEAEVLVSGDAAVLALRGKTPFAVESATDFLGRFGDS